MKNQERQSRIGLTLLFTAVVQCFILLTVMVGGLVLYLLVTLKVITGQGQSEPSLLTTLLFFAVISFVMGVMITFVLSRVPLRPINSIINSMNRLASGDFRVRLKKHRLWGNHPAVKEFTNSFNSMAEELESTEMLREDFINNFSHEFKTPIVSIAGFAKLLRRGGLTEGQQREYAGIIEEESMRLAEMASKVLELTNVENQTILAAKSRFNLSEQIRSCILLLNSKWESKDIEFLLELDEHYVTADEELLKQVWINLLDNAVKFSPHGGEVEVRIRRAELLTVEIANRAGRISEKQQGRLFNKFYQADESHAQEGSGVGLAIVKRAVELHGGSVSVSFEGGKASFTVCLPV